jgi:hypothetical protein
MATIPSLKLAAGIFGITAVMKLSALAAALALLAPSTAGAGSLGRPCTAAPKSEWLSIETLQSKIESQGYKVQKAKLANACGELYAIDANGARVELFVDPTSGSIVGRL